MDQFGVLTETYGLKPQGKSAPMASAKRAAKVDNSQTGNFGMNSGLHSKSVQYRSRSPQDSAFDIGSFLDGHNGVFRSSGNKKTQHSGGLDDGIDFFGGPNKSASPSNASNGGSFDYDSIFMGSNNSVSRSSSSHNYVDDVFGGMPGLKNPVSPPKQSVPIDDLLDKISGLPSKSQHSNKRASVAFPESIPEFDDLIPGFGGSNPTNNSRSHTEMNKPRKQTVTSHDDPFLVFETTSSTASSGSFLDSLEQISKLNNSQGTTVDSNTPTLRPPPQPTNGVNINKVNNPSVSSIDELEEFAMGKMRNNARVHIHASETKQNSAAKTNKSQGSPGSEEVNQSKTADDLESFFSMSTRSSSVPKSRATTSDQTFGGQMQNKKRPEVPQRATSGKKGPEEPQRTASRSAASVKKPSVKTSFDDLSLIFDEASLSSEFLEVEGETEERRKARLGRHQRTEERAAKAVADMKQRNHETAMEQEEKRRIAETVDVQIKRWASGKEGNLRALLSTLQYVLGTECGWQPVSLTDMITSASVKKVYRKATLSVHPDKVQQKGVSLEQKYIAAKVFDILKEAWNKFNAEELS